MSRSPHPRRARTHRVSGTVVRLDSQGRGVVSTAAGAVRVHGVWPGEHVRVQVQPGKGKLRFGKLCQVDQAAEERVTPPCPVSANCGGCAFMHVDHQAQLQAKADRIRGELQRAGAQAPVLRVVSGPTTGYRRRVRLHFSGPRIGYHRPRSRELLDAEQCLVLRPSLREGIAAARAHLTPHLRGQGMLWLSVGAKGHAVIGIFTPDPQPPAVYQAAQRLADDARVAGVALRTEGVSADALWGQAHECIPHPAGPLRSSPFGFSQANDDLNEGLRQAVVELAEPNDCRLLELYSGHGNLTVDLARQAQHVTAVEASREAVRACLDNLAGQELDATVHCVRAEDFETSAHYEVVVMDPPRAGAQAVIEPWCGREPSRVVYVSCQPSSLGRDVAAFLRAGYEPDRGVLLDMFPHTAYVETVLRFIPSRRALSSCATASSG